MTWWANDVYDRTARWTLAEATAQRQSDGFALAEDVARIVAPQVKLVPRGPTHEVLISTPYHVFRALQGIVDAWGWLAQPTHWDHSPSPEEISNDKAEHVQMERELRDHLREFTEILAGRFVHLESVVEAVEAVEDIPPTPTEPTLKVAKLSPGAVLPTRATPGSAGLDLHMDRTKDPCWLVPGGRVLVPTGLQVIIPPGYEGQVRPRSGLALRRGITVLNSPGTIDADYRGELGVLLVNLGHDPVRVDPGERIAQFVIAPVAMLGIEETSPQPTIPGRSGGFGSTGS